MEILFNFLDYIQVNVENNFNLTLLLFFLFMLFYNSFSMPGNIILIASTGFFFGIYVAYLISIFTLVLGSLIFFTFSHHFIKKKTPKIIDKYTLKFNKLIANSSFEYLIIFRMIPGTPLFFQNILLSFLDITKFNFILTSFIGFTPLVFIIVFIGNKLKDINKIKNLSIYDIFSLNVLLFIFFLITIIIIRILFKKK